MSNSVVNRIRSLDSSAITVIAIILVLALIMFRVSSSNGATEQTTKSPMTVSVREVHQSDSYQVDRYYVGRVEARRMSDAGFEIGGLLSSVWVEEGDRVNKGDVIATLDIALLEAQRTELVSARDSAMAQMSLADTTRARVREANELDAVSAQAMDEAEQSYSSNQARLDGTISAIASLDLRLDKSELKAPYDAIISMRYFDEGEVIGVGTPVVKLLENTSPEIRVGVSADAIQQLNVGQDYPIKIGEQQIFGNLKTILPERRTNTRNIDAIFQLGDKSINLRTGDLAELILQDYVNTAVFRLPVGALTESARGIWAIYVVVDDNEGTYLDRRQIELLHHQGDDVFVRGTLSEAEQVVVSGIHRLVPNQRVKAVPENQTLQTAYSSEATSQ